MSITTGERARLPQPRESQDVRYGNGMDDASEVKEQNEAERHSQALHRALALTADQALTIFDVFNVRFVNRDGERLPGGAMGIRVRINGPDTGNPSERSVYITDGERAGLDEDTITELGAQAQRRPTGIRTIL